jgi:hypothetical protein
VFHCRNPERIYEWYVEISRPKDGEDGHIMCIYPKENDMEDDTKKQLPKFAFPTTVVNEGEEHFTFVLTDLDSKYRFGFCLYRPKGDTCMCIISDLPWYKVFYRALDKISEFKLAMQVLYIYSNMCTVVGIDDHKSLSQFKTLKRRYYDAFPGIVGL